MDMMIMTASLTMILMMRYMPPEALKWKTNKS
jgi:hypothetical protein